MTQEGATGEGATDQHTSGGRDNSAATDGGLTRRGGSAAGARLRVAIVGGGFMAEVHSRAARAARAELAGIVSSTPERSAAAAERLGIGRAYASIDEVLADDSVDVVHVT